MSEKSTDIRKLFKDDNKKKVDYENPNSIFAEVLKFLARELVYSTEYSESELSAESHLLNHKYIAPMLKHKIANRRHLKRKKEQVLERVIVKMCENINLIEKDKNDEHRSLMDKLLRR